MGEHIRHDGGIHSGRHSRTGDASVEGRGINLARKTYVRREEVHPVIKTRAHSRRGTYDLQRQPRKGHASVEGRGINYGRGP